MIRRIVFNLSLACAVLLAAPAPRLTAQTAPPAPAAGSVAITAPGTVDPGQGFTATISGAAGDGRIEMWGPVDGAGKGGLLGSIAAAGGAVEMTAPLDPGSYELRYLGATGAVLSRFVLDVAAVPVTLSIGSAIGAGLENAVTWRGPGGPGDMIQIYDPGTRSVAAEAPAIGRSGASNVTMIRAPERFGAYELRYWSGSRQAALRTLPVVVEEGTSWLRSPVEVFVGESFTVNWHGPAAPGHVYRIVDPATDTVLTEQPAWDGTQAVSGTLTAPKRAGRYRIRFVDSATGFVLADLPIEIDQK